MSGKKTNRAKSNLLLAFIYRIYAKMVSLCFQITHPRFDSSISCSFLAKSRKCKFASNICQNNFVSFPQSSKTPIAMADFAVQGSDEESMGRKTSPEGLRPELMPAHVAVIMDGNRRWAIQKGLSPSDGHTAALRRMQMIVRICHQLGVKVVTLFAFSTENWLRHKEEVDFLMTLLQDELKGGSLLKAIMELGLPASIIGSKTELPKSVRDQMAIVEQATKDHKGTYVNVAINYGGRQDIVGATKKIASQVKDGKIMLDEIDEELLAKELQTRCNDFPNPDLLIRTGGEKRQSNFLLWQLAYTELYFADKLFPDFEAEDFRQAIISYQQRQRRFGGHEYKS